MYKKLLKIFIILLFFSICIFLLGYSTNLEFSNTPNIKPNFKEIFINNIVVNFRVILLSILTGGIYSIVFLSGELFFLGAIIKYLTVKHSFLYAISFIGFHGIFEIPSIVLSATIGIYFFTNLIHLLKKRGTNFKLGIISSALLIILIVISAVVETFITPWFLRNYIL
ncbi:MAG: stage II sporulation protein M [Eubacteriaceae bacterium]